MANALKNKYEEWKPFFVVLVCTAIVWIGVAMSDVQNYTTTYYVKWVGVDTARYAIIQEDTTVQVILQSNGFSALGRSLHSHYQHLVVDVSNSMPEQEDETFVVTTGTRSVVLLSNQRNNLSGIRGVSTDKEYLQLHLAERHHKAFAPVLTGVEYTFVSQFGLDGQPKIAPDSIYLYGSEASLSRIDEVHAVPTVVANIGKSDYHRVDLDKSCWSKYPDVHPSVNYVDIYIPVQRFTEKSFVLPIQVKGLDSNVRVNLYPPKVKLTVWVPTKDYARLKDDDFRLTVNYSDTVNSSQLDVNMEKYPSMVRLKKIVPDNIHFVIIK